MTMTKSNPRFAPPELWVLGGVGDSFAEFMAGGVAVVCGIGSHHRKNHVLGHRPCVGMVGGKIFFHGVQKSFSESDAKLVRITDDEWGWLKGGLKNFLEGIGKEYLYDELTHDRSVWQLLTALHPSEKASSRRLTMSQFRGDVWDRELGKGGLTGDLTDIDSSPLPVVPKDIYAVDIPPHAPIWGDPNAPLTIVLFTDFECPFCGRMNDTFAQLKKEFEGKLRIVFVNLPLKFHNLAVPAAKAALAAGRQERFWEMHDRLFAEQTEWKKGTNFDLYLEGLAQSLKLDIVKS